MIPVAFARAAIACIIGLLIAMPALAVESLPMPVAHYAELCQRTGGSMMRQLTGGVGMVQCQWPSHGRTECKVGADQVSICRIVCESNACLKSNPARLTPIWPLQGGPNGPSN
jgi:hypothetical protein